MFETNGGEETVVMSNNDNSCMYQFFYANINGMNNHKIDDSELMIDANKADFLCFTETHLRYADEIQNIKEYKSYHACSTGNKNTLGRNVKGVSVFVKEAIEDTDAIEVVNENGNLIILKIYNEHWYEMKEIFLIVCYRDNRESKYADKDYLNNIKDYIFKFNMKNIILIGDLNGRIGQLNDNEHNDGIPPRASNDKKINKFGRELIEFCNDTSLIITNGRFEEGKWTFIRLNEEETNKSVIDYLIISESMIPRLKTLEIMEPRLYTDHMPIKFEIAINSRARKKDKQTYIKQKQTSRKKPLTWTLHYDNKFDCNKFRNNCQDLLDKMNSEIITQTQIYEKLLTNTETARKETKSQIGKVEYSDETRQIRRTYNRAVEKFKHYRSDENLTDLMKVKKELSKNVRKEKRKMQADKLQQLQTAKLNKEPKKYWQLINNKRTKKTKIQTQLTTDDFKEGILEKDKMLTSANDNIKNTNDLTIITYPHDDFIFLDVKISNVEIRKTFSNLKNSKSSGPDGIVYEIFKNNIEDTVELLVILYNKILDEQCIPWKESWVSPIFKRGNRNDVNSYRCINLSSCLEKMLTRILNERLHAWIEKYDILHPSQIGFRKDNSTLDSVWILKEIIQIRKNMKQPLHLCFLDLSRAFDSIPKHRLIRKLKSTLPNCNFTKLLEKLIETKTYRVLNNGIESDSFELNNGIPQGDSLSPTLFCLYMNDLLTALDNHADIIDPITLSNIQVISLIYADDIVLISQSKEGLTQQIKIVQNYCKANGLMINYEKTKIMIFNEKRSYEKLKFKFEDSFTSIDVVNEYKYLGIVIAQNDRKYLDELISKGKKSSYLTAKTLRDFGYVGENILTNTFEMLTLSKMRYGAELLFDRNLKDLNKVQTQFYKKFYHLKMSTPNYCITGEFGIKPMEYHFYKAALNYWLKLKRSNGKRLIRQIYDIIMINLHSQMFHNTWLFRIQKIFTKLNLEEVWNLDNLVDHVNYNRIFDNTLIEYFRQEWIKSAKNSNKGLNYLELCRFECNPKQYLNVTGGLRQTIPILKMRTGNHALAAEVERYKNRKNYQDRLCSNCDNNEVEELFHFICRCPLYSTVRATMIPFVTSCSKTDFYEIMNSLRANQVKCLSKFVERATAIRNETQNRSSQ